jgi:hypothetical protein
MGPHQPGQRLDGVDAVGLAGLMCGENGNLVTAPLPWTQPMLLTAHRKPSVSTGSQPFFSPTSAVAVGPALTPQAWALVTCRIR